MASYYMNEAVFDLPPRPFADATIHALESKLPDGRTIGVFVQRSAMREGSTLREAVDENVALNQKRLMGYAVTEERQVVLRGEPCVLLRTNWRHERGAYYQRQAHVVLGDKHLIFAASGPLDAQAACDESFGCMLETLTWRDG